MPITGKYLKVYSVKPSVLGERAVMFLHSILNEYGLCVLSDQSFLDLDLLRFQHSHTHLCRFCETTPMPAEPCRCPPSPAPFSVC